MDNVCRLPVFPWGDIVLSVCSSPTKATGSTADGGFTFNGAHAGLDELIDNKAELSELLLQQENDVKQLSEQIAHLNGQQADQNAALQSNLAALNAYGEGIEGVQNASLALKAVPKLFKSMNTVILQMTAGRDALDLVVRDQHKTLQTLTSTLATAIITRTDMVVAIEQNKVLSVELDDNIHEKQEGLAKLKKHALELTQSLDSMLLHSQSQAGGAGRHSYRTTTPRVALTGRSSYDQSLGPDFAQRFHTESRESIGVASKGKSRSSSHSHSMSGHKKSSRSKSARGKEGGLEGKG
jgi:hypothetical protein